MLVLSSIGNPGQIISTLTSAIKHSSRSTHQFIQAKTKITSRRRHIEKEGVKLPLFVNEMTSYLESPKNSIAKLREIHTLNEVAGYKINTYKLAFLYTKD